MPADDRDPKFEGALAHHLRGDSAAACPDAETLAAYHERSLSLEEMAHWKQHISGCAACQETLALVETTEKQLAENWEDKQVPVLEAAAQLPASVRSAGRSQEAAREEASGTPGGPVEIARPRRRPALLRWAIPVGAVAAGVLVWIGIHEQRALQSSKSDAVQVAKHFPAPAPAPEQKLNEAPQTAQSPMERDDRQVQLDEKGSRGRAENSGASQLVSPQVSTARPQAHAKDAEESKKEAGGRAADALAYNDKIAPAPPPPPARGLQPPKAPTSTTESVDVSAGALPAAPEPSGKATDRVTGGAVGGAAGTGMASGTGAVESKSEARAKQKTPTKQQAANDLDTATSAMMMKQGLNGRNVTSLGALAPLPAVILTPDHRVWWRLGPGGTLELTTDGGKTWKLVNVGVDVELTAGSAPSSKVCWIAGKAGTLVRTTDRGTHWEALTTPISGDLGGVRATDAKHASIWDAERKQSFGTSDGGASWKQTAP